MNSKKMMKSFSFSFYTLCILYLLSTSHTTDGYLSFSRSVFRSSRSLLRQKNRFLLQSTSSSSTPAYLVQQGGEEDSDDATSNTVTTTVIIDGKEYESEVPYNIHPAVAIRQVPVSDLFLSISS